MEDYLRIETLNTFGSPSSDPFYTGAEYKSFCGKEYLLTEPSTETAINFFLYAYEFSDAIQAEQYYTAVGGNAVDKTKATNVFYENKFKQGTTTLCVLKDCKAYTVTVDAGA